MADDVVRIVEGPIEVELLPEVGARLHRIRAFGHDLLRTPDDPRAHSREPFFWGGYVMAPWCNRISADPTAVGQRVVRVPASFADGTAIHGQVAAAHWMARPDGALGFRGGGNGWPWQYEVTERVAVAGGTVRIELALTNLDDETMPAGIGLHPWFRGPLEVAVSGHLVLSSNVDAEAQVERAADGPFDLSQLRPLRDGFDATWLDLDDPAVELRWPDLGIEAVMHLRTEADPCVALASPGDLDAVAIEPETHAPQGLRRYLLGEPHALRALPPGETLRLSIDLVIGRSR